MAGMPPAMTGLPFVQVQAKILLWDLALIHTNLVQVNSVTVTTRPHTRAILPQIGYMGRPSGNCRPVSLFNRQYNSLC